MRIDRMLRAAICVVLFGVCLLAGCGGGGGNTPTATPATGGLRFSLVWPTTQQSPTIHRLIPFSAQTIRIAITDPASPTMHLTETVTVTRNTNAIQQVVIPAIRPGAVRVGAEALDAQSVQLAAGTIDATVAPGVNTDVNLQLFANAPMPPGL